MVFGLILSIALMGVAATYIAKLLHRFDLTPEPGYDLTITERLTLMPVGFRVGLTRR